MIASTKHPSTATFVMPVFLDDGAQSVSWLDQAVDSIIAQTDPDWQLIIMNDCSPYPNAIQELERIKTMDERIVVIHQPVNTGPGAARNAAVQWAADHECPFILFLDADDVSHPKRLETVRQYMTDDPSVGVVYSTFIAIDESGHRIPWDKLSGSIQEILECNQNEPPEGETAWIAIGTTTGYANLLSSTAVTTELALKYPFPRLYVSEDSYTWLSYSASGKKFVYTPNIPSSYRIPQKANDSTMRDRVGGLDIFNSKKCDVDRQGFEAAFHIAVANGMVRAEDETYLLARFHVRLAGSMHRAGQQALAGNEIEKAINISPQYAHEWISSRGYDWA